MLSRYSLTIASSLFCSSKEKAHEEVDSESMISGQGTTGTAGSGAFAILTDDAFLTPIFEFVGLYEYRFMAILNKRFRKLYSEFQERGIHPSTSDKYGSTSLTSTASVAKSIDHAKMLMSDMKTREFNYFQKAIVTPKGPPTGPRYCAVKREGLSDDEIQSQSRVFLRDAVALRWGNLQMFQWLRDEGCPWHESTCAEAASNGHLEMLQWLRENGCPWDQETCSRAAGNGHLDVLQWARSNGCPWDNSTCAAAARNGHLDVLKWARAKGCRWDHYTCSEAADNGHLEVLQWARANGCQE